jgi:hypothetical protein
MNIIKKSNITSLLSIGFGAALAIVSLIGIFFAPIVLEAELALVITMGSVAANATVPSIQLLSEGICDT